MMLPLELVDTILDFVETSSTLAACTLVCRDWLISARFHLLSRIELEPDNIDSFFDDLDDDSSNSPFTFPKLTATLANVTSLRIEGLDLSSAPTVLPHLFPNLKLLSLKGFQSDSFSAVATWLSANPTLRSLTLLGDWDEDGPGTIGIHGGPTLPDLTHLELDCPLKPLLNWLLSLGSVPAPSSLVLRDIWDEEKSTIDRYLVAVGSRLESLKLVFPRRESRVLGLTQLRVLRSLTFESHPHAMLLLVFHAFVIQGSNLAELENLTLSFLGMFPTFPTKQDALLWLRVNDLLRQVQSNFQHLRTIHFRGMNPNVDGKQLLPIPIGATAVTTEEFTSR